MLVGGKFTNEWKNIFMFTLNSALIVFPFVSGLALSATAFIPDGNYFFIIFFLFIRMI